MLPIPVPIHVLPPTTNDHHEQQASRNQDTTDASLFDGVAVLPFVGGVHSRFCSSLQNSLSSLILAKNLSFASTSVHGANSVLQRSIMSLTARSYCGHLSRLRQSSSVILKFL